MADVAITSGAYLAVVEVCKSAYPSEVCGLVGMRDGVLDGTHPVLNVAEAAPGSCGFLMESRGQFLAMRQIENAGLDLGAIYHSHPHTPAVPSEADIALAAYPEAVHLIVGLRDQTRPEVLVWRIADGTCEKLSLRIEPEPPEAPGRGELTVSARDSAEGFSSRREAATYDGWYETAKGRAILATEVDALRPLIDPFPEPRVEIGVGTGRFAEALGARFGIDPSRAALCLALRRGVLVAAGAGEAVPLGSGRFGAVIMAFTLCFLADPATALAEARRVLLDTGGLVLGFPHGIHGGQISTLPVVEKANPSTSSKGLASANLGVQVPRNR